ncbi:MAG: ATP-binding cassette domain-containing protein [Deltaproteobacteria bacterium]|nr:ATP-binding cassette domain-containing protein [Deltaproteobacteria bacterium]
MVNKNEELIRTEKLTRRFGSKVAVDSLDISISRGEIVGFLGPNGAGKTTTLRMLTCFLPPSSGKAFVAGFNCFTQGMKVREQIGYMPEAVPLYPEMRVKEYLKYRARLKGVGRAKIKSTVDNIVQQCGLADVLNRIVGQLSRGYRQRLGLADALVKDPSILVLDEPTVGLDPNQVRETRALIRELGKDHTVILSTHILPEVEVLCTRVLIINEGKLVAQGTPSELGSVSSGKNVIEGLLQYGDTNQVNQVKEVMSKLPGEPGVDVFEKGDGIGFVIEVARERDVRPEIFKLCVQKGWVLIGMRQKQGSLEDVFARLTTSEDVEETHDDDQGDSSE